MSIQAATTVQATFLPTADIAVSMVRTPDPAKLGQPLTYTLAIVNHGPNPSSDLKVVEALPAGATFSEATPGMGSCIVETSPSPGTLTCHTGPMTSGVRTSIRVVVIPTVSRTLTSSAAVTSADTYDTSAINSVASTATTVGTLAVDPVVVAAGDIACDPLDGVNHRGIGSTDWCQQKFTADLLPGLHPTAIVTLGDNEYIDGRLSAFRQVYAPTWGVFKGITHPGIGDHEYRVTDAVGYFDYFGAAAGERGHGWYSFDLGGWHLISLNSNCQFIGGCGPGSPEELWLRSDLAAHPATCTLAYFHMPRFSSGTLGSSGAGATFWQDLYNAGADLILNGHAHSFERFGPQTPRGVADPAQGITELVAGTGGRDHYGFATPLANSEVRDGDTFGVLKLVLHPSSYDWEFVPVGGRTFTDAGSRTCH